MVLNERQKNSVQDHIEGWWRYTAHNMTGHCPVCGNILMEPHEKILKLSEKTNTDDDESNLRVIATICKRCGYCMLFDTRKIQSLKEVK